MRGFLPTLAGLAALAGAVAGQTNSTSWPVYDDGLTDLVQWDHYSFMVNGERLFVFSGEFHPWRFPVPELWQDLLEKIKAAGFTAFSIYNSWGFHSASPDSIDFTTGAHNFTSVLTLAKEIGLYVIIRPGPYVNAEANAGGFPLWLTTGAYGSLRNDDARYTAAWKPYWTELSTLIKPHLITNGGNVIIFQVENELNGQMKSPSVADYMQMLEDTARQVGIDVPLSYNAPNMDDYSWSPEYSGNATGNVDVVGLDSYPSCWSCNISECTGTNGKYVGYQVVNYDNYFEADAPAQPNFMPEYQGGSYNPWGGPQGGCPGDIGVDFANMFYRNLILQRVTAVSLYMFYGGTNWGWSAAPVVASSYDYSSPVTENRTIGDKYYETKLLTLFTRAAKDLVHTDRLGLGTNYTTNTAIEAAELRNPETNAAFYVVMHNESSSGTSETLQLHINTSQGAMTVPKDGNAITINGHQAKILPTDFKFGDKTLVYSTAEILSYTMIDGKAILALWLPEGEAGEFMVGGAASATQSDDSAAKSAKIAAVKGGVTVSWTQGSGMSVIKLDGGATVLLLGRQAAYRFWVPSLDNNPHTPVNNTLFVQGPYLVRSATYDSDKRAVHITGDEDVAASMTVFAPRNLCSITWNGNKTSIVSKSGNQYVVSIGGPPEFSVPALGHWKYTNSLPEIAKGYSPTSPAWVVANNTTTPNPTKPAANNPVLYVDDYGIHVGNHIYRATFNATATPPTGVFLNILGATAFGSSVWLNSKYIGSYYGLNYEESNAQTFSFSNATVKKSGENVLVVLMDNSGHDLRGGATHPRGITNATLTGPAAGYNFTEWRIAGTAGREKNIDPVRGPLNEGGLYAERLGMHLPGYDNPDTTWHSSSSGNSTLVVPHAGVRVFRTVAPLHVPAGLDVSISFRLTSTADGTFIPSHPAYSNRLRALLFVNGYQYGRFSPYIGNQIDFPVPPGILNYDGDNTIAVTVWSQSAEGVEMMVEWQTEYVHSTSYDMGFGGAELRPGWSKDRLQYA